MIPCIDRFLLDNVPVVAQLKTRNPRASSARSNIFSSVLTRDPVLCFQSLSVTPADQVYNPRPGNARDNTAVCTLWQSLRLRADGKCEQVPLTSYRTAPLKCLPQKICRPTGTKSPQETVCHGEDSVMWHRTEGLRGFMHSWSWFVALTGDGEYVTSCTEVNLVVAVSMLQQVLTLFY